MSLNVNSRKATTIEGNLPELLLTRRAYIIGYGLRYGVGGNGRANDGLVGFTLVAARATFMTALKLSFVATIVRNLLSRYEILLSRDVILFRRYTILITKRTLLRTTGVRYEKRDETMRFNGIKRRT